MSCTPVPCARCERLGRAILALQKALEEKNRELDALGYVWCDGACAGGVFRHTEGKLTADMVRRAKRAVARMERRFLNEEHR